MPSPDITPAPSTNAPLRAVLGVIALAWGFTFTIASHTPYGLYWASFILVGWCHVGAGLVAWGRRPDNRTGRLMVLTGFLFLIPTFASTRIPLVWTVGAALSDLAVIPLVYVVLGYPRGFLTGWPSRTVFGCVAAAASWTSFLSMPFFDPREIGCADCPEGLNLLLVRNDPELLGAVLPFVAWLIVASLTAFVGVLVTRWVRATRPARRILWPVYVSATVWGLSHVVAVVDANFLGGGVADFSTIAIWTSVISLNLLPAMFLIGVLHTGVRRGRVGEMVLELGRLRSAERLQDAVARTLGDSSVEVGYWLPERGGYVTAEGRPVTVPPPEPGRTTTLLERQGEPLAAIVHDAALLEDPTLLDAVAAAARLAVENEHLEAQVRAQLEEVRQSRQRIVEAGDAERRRIERNLHDGAQQRLISLALAIRLAKDRLGSDVPPAAIHHLDEAAAGAREALVEVRDLARGLHPAILSERGLALALESLAERAPIAITVSAPAERFLAPVEATAYFVAAEALANAAKHAGASRAAVSVRRADGDLVVEVTDDGVGGADPRQGSGLCGLADRVAAVDGLLGVDSPPGRGTKVVARIPCA